MKWVFGADTAPFRKGLDEMRSQTKAFAGSVKSMIAGALSVGLIVNGFKNLFAEMDRVQKLGQRFGESAESIQKIGLAAELSGVSLEGIAKFMTVVTKNANEAATKGGSMAEAFDALGINASEFVNMPIEEKVLKLAETFQNGKGSGEQLSLIMKVLGKSGAEMIPLLSQGMEELQKQFDNTSTISQRTVDSMAAFNDAVEMIIQKVKVLGGDVVGAFQLLAGAVEVGVGFIVKNAMNGFNTLIDAAGLLGEVFKKTMSRDFEGSAAAILKFKDIAKNALAEFKVNVEDAVRQADKLVMDTGSGKPKGPQMDVESIEEAIEAEERRKKLVEEIAKLKEEAANAELDIQKKIEALEEKRKKLQDSVGFLAEEDSLEEQKALLETEKELKKLKEDQAKIEADAKKKADEKQKEADQKEKDRLKTIQAAKDEEAKTDRDLAFNKLDDEGKIKMLKKEQADLMAASKSAAESGDEEASIKLRTQAKLKGAEIEDLITNKQAPAGPTIAASSLAAIGAGGNANLLGNSTIEQRKVSLLEQIAQNTARGETGSTKIPDPVN